MTDKTNFQKIIEFHKAFGLEYYKKHQEKCFDNTKLIKLRLDLIQEELNELKEAIEKKDFTEVRDAIGDILYVTYGAAASFGINADKDYNIIHKSNMTKLCKTEKEALETIESYKKKFVEGTSPYDTPAYKKSEDGVYYIVFNKSSGKILKSINYTPVSF